MFKIRMRISFPHGSWLTLNKKDGQLPKKYAETVVGNATARTRS